MKKLLAILVSFFIISTAFAGVTPVRLGGTGENTRQTAIDGLTDATGGSSGYQLTTDGSNTSWQPSGGNTGVWGSITGTLSDQTDLQSELDAKEEDLTFSTGLARSVNTITTDDPAINHDNLLNYLSSEHFTEASIDHLSIQSIGTNSHAGIDSHIADGTIHFDESSIDHLNIQNIGTNSHTGIDSHISDLTIHFSDLSGFDTDDLSEGSTNLYYTDSRARASISETVVGLDYSNITGVFSTTSGYGIPTTASQTQWDDAYSKRVDTWGDGLEYSTQTASVDYNSTNLKITAGEINTIQDISSSSSPTFDDLTVTDLLTAARIEITGDFVSGSLDVGKVTNTNPAKITFLHDTGTGVITYAKDNTFGIDKDVNVSGFVDATDLLIGGTSLGSATTPSGASLVGISDDMGLYVATEVETALGEVMDKVTPVTYVGNSIATLTGTVDAGDVTSTQTINDGNSYDVSEVTGAPGYDIQVTFTGITAGHEANKIQVNIDYNGNHSVSVQLEKAPFDGSAWDTIDTFTNTFGSFKFFNFEIGGNITDYVNSGTSKLRFNHLPSGNPSHDILIDFASLKDDSSGGGGITSHPAMSNNAWLVAGHESSIGISVAGFDNTNAAIEYTLSGTGTELALTTSPKFNVSIGIDDVTQPNISWFVNGSESAGLSYADANGLVFDGVNPNMRIFGDLLVDGGDIGITADTDLIQLSSGLVSINGKLTNSGDLDLASGGALSWRGATGTFDFLAGEFVLTAGIGIGVIGDTDLIQMTSDNVGINGMVTINSGTTDIGLEIISTDQFAGIKLTDDGESSQIINNQGTLRLNVGDGAGGLMQAINISDTTGLVAIENDASIAGFASARSMYIGASPSDPGNDNLQVKERLILNATRSHTNPPLTFAGDENTGLSHPSEDKLIFSANGQPALYLSGTDGTGRLGVHADPTGIATLYALQGNDQSDPIFQLGRIVAGAFPGGRIDYFKMSKDGAIVFDPFVQDNGDTQYLFDIDVTGYTSGAPTTGVEIVLNNDDGTGATNTAFKSSAIGGGSINWAGLFGEGDVKIENTLVVDGIIEGRHGIFHARKSGVGSTFTTSPYPITWDVEIIEDSTYFSHGAFSATITLLKAGSYKVSYSVPVDVNTGVARSTAVTWARLDGTVIPQSGSTSYHRIAGGGDDTASKTFVITGVTANQNFDLEVVRYTGGDTLQTQYDATFGITPTILIEYIGSN